MYLPEKPIDFYKDEEEDEDVPLARPTDNNSKSRTKRAETWVQDESRSLIGLRRDTDCLFNSSKSNKHLWEHISSKMHAKGFDSSPTMCTDEWRNLLKEFNKAKMSYYKEIDQILKDRTKIHPAHYSRRSTPTPVKVDSFMHFADKGFEEASISFGPVEETGRSTLNLERHLDQDGHPLSISAADAVGASGIPPWNWRETPGNGAESQSYGGRVIMVKYGDYTQRSGIDGTTDSIKEAIRCAFRLRTKRALWLEDEDQIIRCLDRDMPLGNYTAP